MAPRQVLQALTGLFAALFTAILSSTIVANALPAIISDLNGSQTDFAWVITAALLAGAVTTPIWGKLADLFDKKLLVQLSIVIFVGGSVLAGLSQNIPLLLTGRVIQGIAMGGLTAVGMAIIAAMVSPRERGRYSGYLGGVMAGATAAGPLLGGVIVDSPLGWRWTFFVVVPLAVIALILLQLTLKLVHHPRRVVIDWLGAVLLTLGVSTLLIWVSFVGKADTFGWTSLQSISMVGGSVLLLGLLVLVEFRAAEPVIPLKIITERTTALAIVASLAVGVAMFASMTYLGQYYQVARGFSATEAGLLTLPMIAGHLVGSIASGQLITRFGSWKRFLVGGAVLLVIGLGLAGTIDELTDLWFVGGYTFLFGLGLGMLMQNLVLAVQNTVSVKDVGSASASVAFFRTIGGAIGVAALGTVMGSQTAARITEGLRAAGLPSGSPGVAGGPLDALPAPVVDVIRAAFGESTAVIFLISAGISVLALVSVLFIKEKALRQTVDLQPTAADPQAAASAQEGPSGEPSATPAAGLQKTPAASGRHRATRVG
jgi:EmrB/QacA subfamily drug resistance transporter